MWQAWFLGEDLGWIPFWGVNDGNGVVFSHCVSLGRFKFRFYLSSLFVFCSVLRSALEVGSTNRDQ